MTKDLAIVAATARAESEDNDFAIVEQDGKFFICLEWQKDNLFPGATHIGTATARDVYLTEEELHERQLAAWDASDSQALQEAMEGEEGDDE